MKILSLREGEWIVKPTYKKKVLLDPKTLGTNSNQFQINELASGKEIPMRHHEFNSEILYVLEGEAILLTDNERKKIKKGNIILIEPHDGHGFINKSKKPFRFFVFKINFKQDDLVVHKS